MITQPLLKTLFLSALFGQLFLAGNSARAADCVQYQIVESQTPSQVLVTTSFRVAFDAGRANLVMTFPTGSTQIGLVEFNGQSWGTPISFSTQAPYNQNVMPVLAYFPPSGKTIILHESMFTWDGATITEEPCPISATLTGTGSMVYDSQRGVLVLFGGGLQSHNQTWEYDGSTWSQKFPKTSPPPRQRHALTYDSSRGVVVMFGGRLNSNVAYGDLWEYDGTNWTQRTISGPTPAARFGHTLTYDPVRGLSVMRGGFGNETNFNDTWEYDGQTWTQRAIPNAPSVEYLSTAVYDSFSHVIRIISTPSSPSNFHAIVRGPAPPQILSQPINLNAQPGQPVQFAVVVQQDAGSIVTYQWRFNGQPIFGANLAAYTIQSVTGSHQGVYDCVIKNWYADLPCGTATSIGATLVVNLPTCPGDNNGDGIVNVNDLLTVINAWGPCP